MAHERPPIKAAKRMPWYEYLPSGYRLKDLLLMFLLIGLLVALGIGDSWLAVHA